MFSLLNLASIEEQSTFFNTHLEKYNCLRWNASTSLPLTKDNFICILLNPLEPNYDTFDDLLKDGDRVLCMMKALWHNITLLESIPDIYDSWIQLFKYLEIVTDNNSLFTLQFLLDKYLYSVIKNAYSRPDVLFHLNKNLLIRQPFFHAKVNILKTDNEKKDLFLRVLSPPECKEIKAFMLGIIKLFGRKLGVELLLNQFKAIRKTKFKFITDECELQGLNITPDTLLIQHNVNCAIPHRLVFHMIVNILTHNTPFSLWNYAQLRSDHWEKPFKFCESTSPVPGLIDLVFTWYFENPITLLCNTYSSNRNVQTPVKVFIIHKNKKIPYKSKALQMPFYFQTLQIKFNYFDYGLPSLEYSAVVDFFKELHYEHKLTYVTVMYYIDICNQFLQSINIDVALIFLNLLRLNLYNKSLLITTKGFLIRNINKPIITDKILKRFNYGSYIDTYTAYHPLIAILQYTNPQPLYNDNIISIIQLSNSSHVIITGNPVPMFGPHGTVTQRFGNYSQPINLHLMSFDYNYNSHYETFMADLSSEIEEWLSLTPYTSHTPILQYITIPTFIYNKKNIYKSNLKETCHTIDWTNFTSIFNTFPSYIDADTYYTAMKCRHWTQLTQDNIILQYCNNIIVKDIFLLNKVKTFLIKVPLANTTKSAIIAFIDYYCIYSKRLTRVLYLSANDLLN